MNDKQEEAIRIIEAIGTTTVKQTPMRKTLELDILDISNKPVKEVIDYLIQLQERYKNVNPVFIIGNTDICLEIDIEDVEELFLKKEIENLEIQQKMLYNEKEKINNEYKELDSMIINKRNIYKLKYKS